MKVVRLRCPELGSAEGQQGKWKNRRPPHPPLMPRDTLQAWSEGLNEADSVSCLQGGSLQPPGLGNLHETAKAEGTGSDGLGSQSCSLEAGGGGGRRQVPVLSCGSGEGVQVP